MEKRGSMKNKIVYCPECAAEIYKYDGVHTSEIVVRCSHCDRYIKYSPLKGTKIINKPETTSSSGVRFW